MLVSSLGQPCINHGEPAIKLVSGSQRDISSCVTNNYADLKEIAVKKRYVVPLLCGLDRHFVLEELRFSALETGALKA